MKPIRVLFVCLGNICRSPTAQGLCQKMIEEKGMQAYFELDSAGTCAEHTGERPDPRALRMAKEFGVRIEDLKARQASCQDFFDFDYILAMDHDNLKNLKQMAPKNARAHLDLLLHYSHTHPNESVPDPYFGGEQGFRAMYPLMQEALEQFIREQQINT